MTLLLTSFAPWKAHQTTNSSDDLVMLLRDRRCLPARTRLLRHLPVHFQLAPGQVISALYQHRPSTVVCCGMAETRSLLNLERYGHGHRDRHETPIDLAALTAGLQWTQISHDAGDFVCNALYYQLLGHVQKHDLNIQCLFVHVPPLNEYNREPIMRDCGTVLSRLQARSSASQLTAA